MKRWIAGVVVVAALAAAAVFGMRMMAQPPEELDLARDKPSANQLYRVSIQPELDPPAIGTLHNWIVTVLLSDGEPVVDAKISVAGGMPQHGHGLPTAPQVTKQLGEGRYLVEGVRFNMGGWWELKFTIDASAGSDNVTFNLTF